jgi:hypothetical protein
MGQVDLDPIREAISRLLTPRDPTTPEAMPPKHPKVTPYSTLKQRA